MFQASYTIGNRSLVVAMASVFSCVNWLGLGYAQTVYEADFDTTFPTFGYSYDYSGYGELDYSATDTSDQTTSTYSVNTPPAATATLDTTQWALPGYETYTYVGWGLGIGFYLPEGMRPTSSDLSQYTVSFEASVSGYDEDFAPIGLDTPITIIFQGPGGQSDEFRIGVNGDNLGNFIDVPMLTSSVQNFSIPFSDFADLNDTGAANYWDFPTMFADTAQILVQLQPSSNAADIGIDNDNIVTVDNVRVEGPFAEAPPVVAGDFSGNGSVENADLTLLLDNWGQPVPPVPSGWVGAEPTSPAIDNDELTALLDNWGAMQGGNASGTSSVPEPTSLALCILAVAAYALRSGRRRAF